MNELQRHTLVKSLFQREMGLPHCLVFTQRTKQNRFKRPPKNTDRGIEWSLRAFASTRALRLFLRARAVIKFVLRAASTSETTTVEQRTLHNFSANFTRRLIRVRLVP